MHVLQVQAGQGFIVCPRCRKQSAERMAILEFETLTEQSGELLVFTDRAAAKVKNLVEEEGNDALKLRVFVTGGGCAGFQYGFTFDELVAEDDAVIQNGDVALVVDSLSYQYLANGVVDYVEGLEGSRFVVENPNAETTCGCGSSFSV